MRPEISTIQLPAGNMGSYYRSKLTANGNGNIQFSADEKKLPPGLRLYPDGTIKVFDNNGKYLMFDKITDLFANAEPRLRAYVILPGDVFKGEVIDIRRGIYTGDAFNLSDQLYETYFRLTSSKPKSKKLKKK